VIRGNSSEIKKLYELYEMDSGKPKIETGSNPHNGVDVSDIDIITEDNLDYFIIIAKKLATYSGAIIVMTGAIDIITDGIRVKLIYNGCTMLKLVSGSGCMLSAVIGAYCGANPQECFDACVAAVGTIGLCGDYAYERMQFKQEGSASYRIHLIDYVSQLDGSRLMRGIRMEER
jgi:hydroxyethylthiazole kinase